MSTELTIHWPQIIDLLADETVATSTRIEIPNADGVTVTVLEGTGFTYDANGNPIAGTISFVRLFTTTGEELQNITNIHTSLGDIGDFVGEVDALRSKLSWFGVINQDVDQNDPAQVTLTATKFTFLNSDGTKTVINGTGLDWSGLQFTGNVSSVQRYAANGTTLLSNVNAGGVTLAVAVSACYDVRASEQVYQLVTAGDNIHTGVNGEVPVGSYLLHDALHDGPGNDTFNGALHNSAVDYGWAPSAVNIDLVVGQATGGGGTDTLIGIDAAEGSMFDDVITGSSVANWLIGGDGNDSIVGLNGDDMIIGSGGDDTLNGGGNSDTVSYLGSGHAAAGVTVSLALQGGVQDTVGAGSDTLSNFENLTGSIYDDHLTGDASANIIKGDLEGDEIEGGAGADTLDGGAGEDTLSYRGSAGAVNVTLVSGGPATVSGGDAAGDDASNFEDIVGSANDDTLTGDDGDNVIEGSAGADTINGGANTTFRGDSASYAESGSAVQVDLEAATAAGGDAAGDVLSGIENLFGSAHGDTLTGDAGDNWIEGGAGADTLDGGSGSAFYGDWLQYVASSGAVVIDLESGTASGGDAAGDVFTGFQNVAGSQLADNLTGDAQDNIFEGGDGADTMNGAGIAANGDTASYVTSDAAVTVSLLAHTASGGHAAGDVLTSIENLIGSGFNDVLTGDAGNNILSGADGNDTLVGGANGAAGDTAAYTFASAAVTVSLATTARQNTLGAGSDSLSGIENLLGSEFGDALTGSSGKNVLSGLGGDDTLLGGLGNDTLDGGDGSDTASYAGAASAVVVNLATGTASGGAGIDTLLGIESVIGSNYNDTLTAAASGSVLGGGLGNDVLVSGVGDDTLDGGGGSGDTVSYALASQGVNVSLELQGGPQATASAGSDTLSGFENIIGSYGNDRLTGDGGNNRIDGGYRSDTIEGGAGNDTLIGGAGIDDLSYEHAGSGVRVSLALTTAQNTLGTGTDTVSGFENLIGSNSADTLTGSSGDNTIMGLGGDDIINGGAGADYLDGGTGTNTVSYAGSTAGVTVDLAIQSGFDVQISGGYAAGDILLGFANAIGSSYADRLTGDGASNVLEGGLGNDILDGAGGVDTVSYVGASGAVNVNMATGRATGAAGTDTLINIEAVIGSNYNDVLTAGSSGSHLMGGVGDDTLIGGPNGDTLDGGSGANTASYAASGAGVTITLVGGGATGSGGDAEADVLISIRHLTGGSAGDTFTGDGLANRLSGAGGDDTLVGGAGIDTLTGGAGVDLLTGGADRDVFDFNAISEIGKVVGLRDVISDFIHGLDDIDLSTIDASTKLAGNQAFKFIGTQSFHRVAGELHYRFEGGTTIVEGDTNGDRAADFQIELTGVIGLTAGDFIL